MRRPRAGHPDVFITKDTNLRIRADALGLQRRGLRHRAGRDHRALHRLHRAARSPRDVVDQMYKPGAEVEVPGQDDARAQPVRAAQGRGQPVAHRDGPAQRGARASIVPLLRTGKEGVWGVRPRNMEQTLRARPAAQRRASSSSPSWARRAPARRCWRSPRACRRTTEESVYQKLLVSRPIFPLGRDIGYLPGDVEEKLNPWMQPIFDNVEFLMNLSRADKKAGRGYHELMDLGIIEIEPLTYIRGRSASRTSSSSSTRRRTSRRTR